MRDNTRGKARSIAQQLLEMDKLAQRLNGRIKAIGLQKFAATIRLIDRVTEPGSRINELLKRMAGAAYRITMRLNDSALNGIRKIETALARLTSKAYNLNIGSKVTGAANNLLNGAAMASGIMFMGGAVGVGLGVGSAVQNYAAFQKQMSQVQAIRQLDKNSPEMQALTEQAKQLGRETAWTRQQVGEAQYYQALAGWSSESILKSTPHMLNLASAAGLDLGRTSDIVTDSLTAFGIKATENYRNKQGQLVNVVEGYADMMAKVQAISNTDVSQLGEALKYAAPAIGTIGRGQSAEQRMQIAEDSMIMAGLMADAGIKGSMAGTSLRAVFSRFAGQNRNALFSLRSLGVEVERGGEMLSPGEIMKNLRQRVNEGVDPNQLMTVMEEFAGKKIHADTRRKLDSFLANTLANGGKIGSADLMKMASMMAGQEAMSGLLAILSGDWDAKAREMGKAAGSAKQMADVMMDNLAGSFTKLGSAWDSFTQDLLEGKAGDGLRGFVDALTQTIARADKLFSAEGLNFTTIAQTIGDVISQLKNKILEFDGIGSILAGGALIGGLLKIASTARRVMGYLRGVQRGTSAAGTAGALGQSVGTMNVQAGVVNINGRVAGSPSSTGGAGAKGTTRTTALATARTQHAQALSQYRAAEVAAWANPANVSRQNALRMAQINLQRAEQTLQRERVAAYNSQLEAGRVAAAERQAARAARFSNIKTGAAGGAAFAGIFGALDLMNLKSQNTERLAAAETPEQRIQIEKENRQAEWEAGAGVTGSVIGAAIGGGLGSIAGPIGTIIGGTIGSLLGEYLGREVGKSGAESEKATVANVKMDSVQKALPGYQPKEYTFGEKQKTFEDYGDLTKVKPKWIGRDWKPEVTAGAAIVAENEIATYQQEKMQSLTKNFTDQYKTQLDTLETYQKQAQNAQEYFSGKDFQNGTKAEAAELNAEQMAQMAAMERGEVIQPAQIEPPQIETETFAENFNLLNEAALIGMESLSETISEGFASLFEGASEIFSGFGESLSSAFESAGEIFSGFGEMVSSSLSAAQESAAAALEGISSAFTSTKEMIQATWSELPGFFGGIFSTLGGVAEAAGAAIYSGLTSVCGAVIGAWEAVASTVSSIIASISAAASSVASMIPSVGFSAALPHHAEGGLISSPEIALIGEAGDELILPLNNPQRTNELLNTYLPNAGTSDFVPMTSNSETNAGVNVNVTFNISNENPQDVVAAIRENLESLTEIIATQLSSKIDSSFGNRSVTV